MSHAGSVLPTYSLKGYHVTVRGHVRRLQLGSVTFCVVR
jgi:hypothetical protein